MHKVGGVAQAGGSCTHLFDEEGHELTLVGRGQTVGTPIPLEICALLHPPSPPAAGLALPLCASRIRLLPPPVFVFSSDFRYAPLECRGLSEESGIVARLPPTFPLSSFASKEEASSFKAGIGQRTQCSYLPAVQILKRTGFGLAVWVGISTRKIGTTRNSYELPIWIL